jgi:hypothetical protein
MSLMGNAMPSCRVAVPGFPGRSSIEENRQPKEALMMTIESRDTACDRSVAPGKCELAIEARFILSAMETAEPMAVERRRGARVRYRVEATLRLASDHPDDPPRLVYTRDLTAHELGFISPVPLPLGSGAT